MGSLELLDNAALLFRIRHSKDPLICAGEFLVITRIIRHQANSGFELQNRFRGVPALELRLSKVVVCLRVVRVELDRLGCNHEELGAALAQRWGFPEFCRVAAGCHHFPAIAEPEYRQMAAIIYAADTLCCQDAIGFNLTAVHQVVDTVGFEGHLPLEIIESTRENLAEICSDAIVIFSN